MKATIDTLGDSIALVLEDCVRQANRANAGTHLPGKTVGSTRRV